MITIQVNKIAAALVKTHKEKIEKITKKKVKNKESKECPIKTM
jgi:hypothetical protein